MLCAVLEQLEISLAQAQQSAICAAIDDADVERYELGVDANHVAFADLFVWDLFGRSAGGGFWTIRAEKLRFFGRRVCGCGFRSRCITENDLPGLCLDVDLSTATAESCLERLFLFDCCSAERRLDSAAHRAGSDVGVLGNLDLEMDWYDRIDGPSHDGDRDERAAVVDDDWRAG